MYINFYIAIMHVVYNTDNLYLHYLIGQYQLPRVHMTKDNFFSELPISTIIIIGVTDICTRLTNQITVFQIGRLYYNS